MRPSRLLLSLFACPWLACAAQQSAPSCPQAAPAPAAEVGPATSTSGAEEAPSVTPREPIQHAAESIAFAPAPPSMPAGVEMAVLEGDPKASGMFTLRLKAPPGFLLPPHTHPVDERVTVISGTISVGFGSSVQRDQAKHFSAGSFYVNPPGVAHYVFSDQGAVVQITGMGPWRVQPLAAY